MALTEIPSELSSTPSIVDGGNATAITIDSSENVTLAGNILHAGDLTLDVAGDIILDADGADIIIKDGGTTFLEIDKDGNNARIKNPIQDGNILFQGIDGGSGVNALLLNMQSAGEAVFNSSVTSNKPQGGTAFYASTAGSYFQGNGSSSNAMAFGMTGGNSSPATAASTSFGFHHWNNSAWANPVNITRDGIAFNGDTAAANSLSDFEEGVWVPASPDLTLSVNATCTYTKIGRMVFVQGDFTFPGSSSGSQARVDGLPFSVNGNGTNSQYNISSGEHQFGSYITCPAIPSNRILFRPNGGGSTSYAAVSGKRFRLSGWYETSQ